AIIIMQYCQNVSDSIRTSLTHDSKNLSLVTQIQSTMVYSILLHTVPPISLNPSLYKPFCNTGDVKLRRYPTNHAVTITLTTEKYAAETIPHNYTPFTKRRQDRKSVV